MKNLKPFLWVFTILITVELIVVSQEELQPFRIFTKPLVVGSILAFFLMQNVSRKTKILISIALLSCLLGDVQMLYSDNNDTFFAGGVLAFFIANIMYIIQFSRSRNKEYGVIAPSLVLLGYATAIFWYLSDGLKGMVVPIAIYIAVVFLMILFAYLRKDTMMDNSYILILAGTLLFMLSNSILAITRYKSGIPYSEILVMGTYGIAQLMLVLGVTISDIASFNENRPLSRSS